MIHGRYHRLYCLAVGERKDCNFGTCHEFLDYDLAAALAELAAYEHGVYSLDCLMLVLRDDNALSESKSVALDDSRVAVLRLYILYCLFRVRKSLIRRSGYSVLLHQRLREHLAALKYRGIGAGTESSESLFIQPVNKSHYQRVVGGHKHEVGFQLFRKLHLTVNVGSLYRETFRKL